jgi:glycosyltransferase involved in cell wall biosynthesis
MNITILNSSKKPTDDRLFFHFAHSLNKNNHKITIICSKSTLSDKKNGIIFNCFSDKNLSKKQKIKIFKKKLQVTKPDIIICPKPLTVIAAHYYNKTATNKAKIIYDITEWYPSKKFLQHINILIRPWAFLYQIFINFYAGFVANAFIFGEYYKAIPFRKIFHKKPFVFTTYYPRIDYITFSKHRHISNTINISFSGKLTTEKGFKNFLLTITSLAEKKQNLKINVLIIGEYTNEKEKQIFEKIIKDMPQNVYIEKYQFLPFAEYLKKISKTDIFLDLRSNDLENQYCLPIKLFYYAAFSRPVIYSDLKAIKKEVKIDQFGFLVNPTDYDKISDIIINYINNDELYQKHCNNARKLFEKEYNWEKIENDFLKFISKIKD